MREEDLDPSVTVANQEGGKTTPRQHLEPLQG